MLRALSWWTVNGQVAIGRGTLTGALPGGLLRANRG